MRLWALLLIVAWLVFELTAQPALAVAAVCVKFGWEDFRTARWLRRSDPDRLRGRACFWLYVASGLWKTAITGTVQASGTTKIAMRMPVTRITKSFWPQAGLGLHGGATICH